MPVKREIWVNAEGFAGVLPAGSVGIGESRGPAFEVGGDGLNLVRAAEQSRHLPGLGEKLLPLARPGRPVQQSLGRWRIPAVAIPDVVVSAACVSPMAGA